MKRVFCLCTESECGWFLVGKEYPVIDGKVLVEPGYQCYPFNNGDITDLATFQIIQREVFEAHGFEWFKHVPGDPMPCDGDAVVCVLLEQGGFGHSPQGAEASQWRWSNFLSVSNIIGWRYAEETKPESQESDLVIEVDDVTTHRQMLAMDLAKVEDTSLSPAQRKHWNEMEAKQAAREKLAKDAQDKALQERAEQMAQAGEALSRDFTNQHDHKMGWR